jgi:hypothetical protein
MSVTQQVVPGRVWGVDWAKDRCGDAAVAGLNKALLAKAAEQKLLRTDRCQHPRAGARDGRREYRVREWASRTRG